VLPHAALLGAHASHARKTLERDVAFAVSEAIAGARSKEEDVQSADRSREASMPTPAASSDATSDVRALSWVGMSDTRAGTVGAAPAGGSDTLLPQDSMHSTT
jgi:hypothetical protein